MSKLYVHAIGMYFDHDPSMNTFYTLIDHSSEVQRTLYYVQYGGDFSLAMNCKFGKNNKIVFEDNTWDRKAYTR